MGDEIIDASVLVGKVLVRTRSAIKSAWNPHLGWDKQKYRYITEVLSYRKKNNEIKMQFSTPVLLLVLSAASAMAQFTCLSEGYPLGGCCEFEQYGEDCENIHLFRFVSHVLLMEYRHTCDRKGWRSGHNNSHQRQFHFRTTIHLWPNK